MKEEDFLELARAKYAEINALQKAPSLLDYERGFTELWQVLGLEVAQTNLGDQGGNHRKKNSSNPPSEK